MSDARNIAAVLVLAALSWTAPWGCRRAYKDEPPKFSAEFSVPVEKFLSAAYNLSQSVDQRKITFRSINRVVDKFAAIPKPDPDSVIEKDMYARCEKVRKMFEEATETDHLEKAGHEATEAKLYFEQYKTEPEKVIRWGGED